MHQNKLLQFAPRIILLALAVLLVATAIYFFFYGFFVSSIGFPLAQTFSGLSLMFLGFVLVDMANYQPIRFFLFIVFVVVGLMILLPLIKAPIPFTSVQSFEMGSFALIIFGFFFSKSGKIPRNIKLYSNMATVLFFLSGSFLTFRETFVSVNPITIITVTYGYFIDASFITGALTLLLLSTLLLVNYLVEDEVSSDEHFIIKKKS